MTRIVSIVSAAFCLGAAWAPAPAAPAVVRTKVVVRWLDRQPTAVAFMTENGEEAFDYDAATKSYSFLLPAQSEVLKSWTLVARYGQDNVPIALSIRRELPGLALSLPRPEPEACNKQAVDRVSTPQDSVPGALRLALEARYLRGIISPDDCIEDLRRRVIRAQLDRTNELIQKASYFSIGQDLQTAYADLNKNRPAALAVLDTSMRISHGVQAKTAYIYQSEAVNTGNLAKAAEINGLLIKQAQEDPALRQGLAEAKVDRLGIDRAIIAQGFSAR